MAGENQALVLTYGADIRALEAQLTRASRLLDTTMGQMVARASTAEKAIASNLGRGNIGKALDNVFDRSRLAVIQQGAAKIPVFGSAIADLGPAGFAAAGGLIAASLAIREMVKAADWAEDLQRASKAMGVTTTQLQEFDFVAQATGIPVEQMRSSLQGLAEVVGRVQDGLVRGKQGAQVKVFEAIFGENADEAKKSLRELGTNLDAILPKILDFAAKLGPTQRAGLAQTLRMDPQTLNSLVDARSKLSGLIDEAHRFGIIVGPDVIKKAGDTASALHVAATVAKDELLVAFANLAGGASGAAQGLVAIAVALGDVVRGAEATFAPITELLDKLSKIPGAKEAAGFVGNFIPGHSLVQLGEIQRNREGVAAAQQEAADTAGPLASGSTKGHVGFPTIDFHTGGSGGRHRGAADNNASETFAVEKAYIEALIKGADDLDKLHGLRLQLIKLEHDSAISEIAGKKGLTPATRALATETANLTFDANVAAENKSYQKQLTDHTRDFADRMAKLLEAQLTSQAEISGTLADRQKLEREKLAEEQAAAARDLADKLASDKGFQTPAGQAEAAQLQAQLAASQAAARDALTRSQAEASAKQKLELDIISLDTHKRLLEQDLAAATTQSQRRTIQLAILAAEEQIEASALQSVIDNKGINSTEGQIAAAKLAQLQALHAGAVAGVNRGTQSPFEAFAAQGRAGVTGEAEQQRFVTALDQLNTGLVDAAFNARNLGEVAKNVFRQLAEDIVKSLLQDAESKIIASAAKTAIGAFLGIPAFAGGTDSAPGGLSLVGEHGPELVSLTKGSQVIPNGTLSGIRALGVQRGAHASPVYQSLNFDLKGAVVTEDLLAQMNAMSRAAEASAVRTALTTSRRGLNASNQQDNLLRN